MTIRRDAGRRDAGGDNGAGGNAPSCLVRVGGKAPRPHEVDADWLEAMLARNSRAAKIAGVSAQGIGTGQIGEAARFTIDYAPGPDSGPRTIVGKFSSQDETSLAVAAAWSLYERELRFYDTIAPHARIDVPVCHGAAMAADGSFALLLEDLAPALPGDQFRGLDLPDAERAVRNAARLHAAFWEQGEQPQFAWLDSGPLAQPFYAPEVFRDTWPRFRDRYAALLADRHIAVCDELAEHYDTYSRPRARPRCITHNDFRPDNMLISPERLTTVDWQSVALGTAEVDIAYLIGGAYDPVDRCDAEAHLLPCYLDEMHRQGVSGYTFAELEQEYRHFTFAGINVAVGAAMLVQRTERGDRLFLTMLDRHVSHVLDHHALDLIRT
ncbi:MAG: ecdysteroid 22-kinase family protein [Novosphingobium sp.]|nr:ecdysteroid 22-kinase family protein [Novosphingobium sp.]